MRAGDPRQVRPVAKATGVTPPQRLTSCAVNRSLPGGLSPWHSMPARPTGPLGFSPSYAPCHQILTSHWIQKRIMCVKLLALGLADGNQQIEIQWETCSFRFLNYLLNQNIWGEGSRNLHFKRAHQVRLMHMSSESHCLTRSFLPASGSEPSFGIRSKVGLASRCCEVP